MFGKASLIAKLDIGITIDKINSSNASGNVKNKQIELFNKYNTTPDNIIDAKEFAIYEKDQTKEKWGKVALITAGVIVAGVAAFVISKGVRHYNKAKNVTKAVTDAVSTPTVLTQNQLNDVVNIAETKAITIKKALSSESGKGLKKYVKPQTDYVSLVPKDVLCWNIKTHKAITEQALESNEVLSSNLKRYVARASELPDLDPKETVDCISPHFYDVLHEDPSFGTINDAANNAMNRFLSHTEAAKQCAKEGNKDSFLKRVGYAVHYLQDAATPPHTEHGNYLHKLFRVPMHKRFEVGKKVGATERLPILREQYVPEEIPFSNIKSLFHNTALFSVQPENHVSYTNVRDWPEIQQRCYDRSVNVTKAFLEYILQFFPS